MTNEEIIRKLINLIAEINQSNQEQTSTDYTSKQYEIEFPNELDMHDTGVGTHEYVDVDYLKKLAGVPNNCGCNG